jgi:hypothetical protein
MPLHSRDSKADLRGWGHWMRSKLFMWGGKVGVCVSCTIFYFSTSKAHFPPSFYTGKESKQGNLSKAS